MRNLAFDFSEIVSVKKVAVAREFIFLIVDHADDSMVLVYELLKRNGHSLICGGKLLPAKDVVDIVVAYELER